MRSSKQQFIEFAIERGALRFGDFTLKSGRSSPYFFNTGLFNRGGDLARLGSFYATAIVDSGLTFDLLYGPAYKGIPLVAAVAIALATEHGIDLPYCFNRKEAKDHGEGGLLVGAPLAGRVLVIDDVITAGTAIRESLDIINRNDGKCVGVAISLDRQERGSGDLSAIQQVEDEGDLRVITIATLNDLIDHLQQTGGQTEDLDRLILYRKEYGIGNW